MRITNNMIFGATTRHAKAHLEKLFTLQNQLASGKKITRPSDDPTGMDLSMLLRGTLSQQTQYQENIQNAGTWLKVTDGALDEAHAVLGRARELAVRGANDTQTEDERNAMAEEVKQLTLQLQVIANSEVNGRFMFGGTKTVVQMGATPPYILPYPDPAAPGDEIVYAGNDASMDVEVVPGVTLPFNSSGKAVFGVAGDPDSAFLAMKQLEEALRSGDSTTISSQIGRLDQAMTRVTTERAVVGSRINRLDLLENRYADAEVSYKERLSEVEEPEFADVVSQVMQQESVYQASLAASARIIQPSLLQFLR